MGRALISAFLHDLSDNLRSLTSQTKPFMMKPHSQRKLSAMLLTLDALVDDAEQMQFTKGGGKAQEVKSWLNDVQDAFYDLEEMLQKMSSINLHMQRQKFFRIFTETKKCQARYEIIKDQIRDTVERLKALVRKKDVLGLTERATGRETLRDFPSSSAVLDEYFSGKYPKDYFYGRDEEEKSVLDNLLSASEESEHIKVINIEGKDGAGKTAFADVIYFNHMVRESFELRAWVTVPYKATVNIMAKKILEAVTEEFVLGNDFNVLRKRFQKSFAGKKLLVVLDDIRIKDVFDWSKLIALFESAAKGSAIILTSSPQDDPQLLMIIPAAHNVHLGSLSVDNSWSIFWAHAFGQLDLHEHRELEEVGKEIVDKLGNLPLAAKMIGSLLQDKVNINQWFDILSSKLLSAGDVNLPIPPFLVLCYLDLPAQLKRCFAYLSLFPKGYDFKQKEVVLLWMAQGYLKSFDSKSNGKSMEDIGDEYFGYLITRSFLQPFGSGVSFIMHNLVHDLATYVFRESRKHHFSYTSSTEDFSQLSSDILGPLSRTILPVYLPLERAPRSLDPWLLEDIIYKANPHIFRVLSLSHYGITDLPTSIGGLSQLCYLDLSHTALQTLPDSICDLLNLQTLMLTNCTSLTSLPKRICNLVNLRYLDVRDSGLQEMPLEMHKLTSLRTLTDFIVSKNATRFGDLAGLSNLKTLTVSKLHNVAYARDASDVKLKKKKSLDDLMLQWGNGNDSNGNEMEVLENLEPHENLKTLTVEYYGGAKFPNWLGDPSYYDLKLVDLRHCENCHSLPTLGLLPFLKDLFIEGFAKVSSIGLEFYGEMTASEKPFSSLKSLHFRDMLEWKEWIILEGMEFPCLIELCIIQCPKLVSDLPKQLPSLEKLEIFGCYDLVAPLPEVNDTCRVFVHDSNEILIRNVVQTHSQASLRRVKISEKVHEITPLSYSDFTEYTIGSSLNEVEEIAHEANRETESTGSRLQLDSSSSDTTRVPKLKQTSSSILNHPAEANIPNIKQQTDPQSSMAMAKSGSPITTQTDVLPRTDTPKTTSVKVQTLSEEDLDDQRSSFEILKVSTVSQLKSLPLKLHSLKIEGCESLEALPNDLLGGITTLKELYLISCSSLRSLSGLGSLTTLYIRNCRRLEFLQSLESRNKLAFLRHLFIGSSCDSLKTLTLNFFSRLEILCIWDCPNLISFYVTGEFRGDLASLESLEIRDCPRLRSFPSEGLHAPNLSSIFLCNCTNLNKLPNAMNSLTSLKSLFVHRCPEIESFPFGGLPSSLTLLSVAYCDKLTPQRDWGLDSLESLNHFELEGGCMGMESFPDKKLLPSNITSLRISTLQSLKKLDYKGFQHLNALQTLEIHCCDMLRSLPDQGLPSSLSHICIQECTSLTPRLKPKTGKEWHKVAHIPHIQIDHQILY